MEMFAIPISILAFLITLWITSFFAILMGAKQANMIWVLAAWLIGGILSATVLVGLNLNFLVLDKMTCVLLSYFIPFVIFTFIYKFLNKMDWLAAIVTNITVIALAVITTVIVIITLGKPLDKTIVSLASDLGLVDTTAIATEAVVEEDYQEEAILSDQDLLSDKVILALERQQKQQRQSYSKPKLQFLSLKRANSAIGYKIRLLRNNGKTLEGLLSSIEGEQLIVQQTLHGGIATTPILMSLVKKLEVYR